MKTTRIYTLIALLMISGGVNLKAQQVKVETSETIELMSIMARTAGYGEYHMDKAGQYSKETEAWFAPFESHPAVAYMQSLEPKHGIGYDAVASTGEEERGGVRRQRAPAFLRRFRGEEGGARRGGFDAVHSGADVVPRVVVEVDEVPPAQHVDGDPGGERKARDIGAVEGGDEVEALQLFRRERSERSRAEAAVAGGQFAGDQHFAVASRGTQKRAHPEGRTERIAVRTLVGDEEHPSGVPEDPGEFLRRRVSVPVRLHGALPGRRGRFPPLRRR